MHDTITQQVLHRKHLGWRVLRNTARESVTLLLRGQTNFMRSMFHFNRVHDPETLLADHARSVAYELPLLPREAELDRSLLYVHAQRTRARTMAAE
jgi:hopanoid C-3 methylase